MPEYSKTGPESLRDSQKFIKDELSRLVPDDERVNRYPKVKEEILAKRVLLKLKFWQSRNTALPMPLSLSKLSDMLEVHPSQIADYIPTIQGFSFIPETGKYQLADFESAISFLNKAQENQDPEGPKGDNEGLMKCFRENPDKSYIKKELLDLGFMKADLDSLDALAKRGRITKTLGRTKKNKPVFYYQFNPGTKE